MALSRNDLHHLPRHRKLHLDEMKPRVLPVLAGRQGILTQLPAETLRAANRARPFRVELLEVCVELLLRHIPLAELLVAVGNFENHGVAKFPVDLDGERFLIELDRLVVVRRRRVQIIAVRLARHFIAEFDQDTGQPLLSLGREKSVCLRLIDRLRLRELFLFDQNPALEEERLAHPLRVLELPQDHVACFERRSCLLVVEQCERLEIGRVILPPGILRGKVPVEQFHRFPELLHLQRLLGGSQAFLRGYCQDGQEQAGQQGFHKGRFFTVLSGSGVKTL